MRYGKFTVERRPRKCPRIDENTLTALGLTKQDIERLQASKAGKALLKSYLSTNKHDLAQTAGKRGNK